MSSSLPEPVDGKPGPADSLPEPVDSLPEPVDSAPEPVEGPSLVEGRSVDSLPEPVEGPWLVVIDPQAIFASPDSAWGSPFFADAMPRIRDLAAAFGDRVIVTRWMPTADRSTSWGEYFAAWPFADQPPTDPLFALIPEATGLTARPTLDLPTFGKWGAEIEAIVGRGAHVVLAGVSTDCCVLSTALAAADAGAHVTIATDACAGSTAENHAAAIHVMGLYPPQITLSDTAAIIAAV